MDTRYNKVKLITGLFVSSFAFLGSLLSLLKSAELGIYFGFVAFGVAFVVFIVEAMFTQYGLSCYGNSRCASVAQLLGYAPQKMESSANQL